jgi:AraC-like DNA-binding protein
MRAKAVRSNVGPVPGKPAPSADKGLFRSLLAGAGHTLREAFAGLEQSQRVDFVLEHPTRRIVGARINLHESEGQGHWNFFRIGDDLFLIVSHFTYVDPRLERLPGDGLLEFHIKLSGQLILSTSRTEPIRVDGPSLLVWNQPEGEEADEWIDSGKEERSVTIYCSPEFITGLLLSDADTAPEHLRKFLFHSSDGINFCQLPLTTSLLQAAASLFDSQTKMPGEVWLVHAEAKAVELLCMIVSAFDQLSAGADEAYGDADLDRFRLAHQIVSKQFNPPPTIAQVARMVGINETKLKHGFKSLYGMTVFEFGHRCRMQHALELLETKRLPVGLVAEQIGYQHQTTFTTAFKSYFGFRPKDVRKLQRIRPERAQAPQFVQK